MIKKILFVFLLIIAAFQGQAQEFKATISVSSAQLEGTDKRVFQELQKSLYEFINDRIWTNYSFGVEERIEVTFMLTLQERISSDEYRARLNIIYKRPVFKTSYETPMFNYIDKDIRFSYNEGEPLNYSDNMFTSNLTSIFAYYLNIILGMDLDSYILFGGTPFFQNAQSIVNLAQSTPEPGWKAFESMKNRYWLVENLLNSSYSPIRQFYYKYHRRGLDVMSENIEMGRGSISNSLEDLRKANRSKPGLFLMQLVLDAKRDELRNIYMEAAPMDKTKAVNILVEIDPANASSYQKILSDRN
jgi:hypothetical protein